MAKIFAPFGDVRLKTGRLAIGIWVGYFFPMFQ